MDTLRRDRKPSSIRFTAISWVLVAAWAGFIFFMSSNTGGGLNQGLGLFSALYQWMQSVQVSIVGPGVDVLSPAAHFCEYAVFGILWVNALSCHMSLARACVVAIVCASLYGVTDEFHQLFVVDRMADPLDWVVDTLGASLGSFLSFCICAKRNTRV
ncbi:MAG: VanZ family protein [Raoultibacter sp.]